MERIQAEEARDMLLALPVTVKTETVSLWQALGRPLGENMTARLAVPPFDRSPVDGYALRAEDTVTASREMPVILSITEEIPAGTVPTKPVGPGQAAKILTGGPMPKGADTTIKYELTEFTSSQVKIFDPCKSGADVVRAGEDVNAGDILGRKGDILTPALAGLLAGQGMQEVCVCVPPTVTVLSTGSELLQPGEPWQPGKIYNTNTTTVCAYLRQAGANAVDGGAVPDELDAIAEKLDGALSASNMVITTGGASVGDYDWAKRAAEAVGAELLFWKIAQKPGGSCLAAVRDGKVLLSLSGNPGAAVLALFSVGLPYVRRLCGQNGFIPEPFTARMGKSFRKKSKMPRFLRGHLVFRDGMVYFVHHEGDGNGILSSLLGCDAVGQIPAGSGPLNENDTIQVFRV
ncbi:MAG: molybdopterin molybdotransferase MoeA [Oscillospiraceae bacterium]|nr:molybdopterin molybdotransferase MoeA [Oscillospiraceae bacterium]